MQPDIKLYLTNEITGIGEYYQLDTSKWPTGADVKILAEMAAGLFIFALTSLKFIQDFLYNEPKDQLARLVNNTDMESETNSP